MILKSFSFDDAMYYHTLRSSSSRDDNLIVGFNNLKLGEKSVYLALTTKYLNMIDEDMRTLLVDIAKVRRVFTDGDDCVYIEFDTYEVC